MLSPNISQELEIANILSTRQAIERLKVHSPFCWNLHSLEFTYLEIVSPDQASLLSTLISQRYKIAFHQSQNLSFLRDDR